MKDFSVQIKNFEKFEREFWCVFAVPQLCSVRSAAATRSPTVNIGGRLAREPRKRWTGTGTGGIGRNKDGVCLRSRRWYMNFPGVCVGGGVRRNEKNKLCTVGRVHKL